VKRETLTNPHLRAMQKRALVLSLVPAAGFALALATLPWHRPTRLELALLAVTYLFNSIGIEVGFHRYFSHQAFRARRGLRIALAILGSSAAQGHVTYWVSLHRRHHKYSDRPGDPHSPHFRGEEPLRGLRGFWHGHSGWIMDKDITNPVVFARDLLGDRDIVWLNRYNVVWVTLGLLIPALAVGWNAGIVAVLYALLWTGLVRLFLVHQAIFAINSLCHMFGSTPFAGLGRSTNNVWLVIPSLGGAWHNNHHAFPRSALTGVSSWQFDPGFWVIRVFVWLRLADQVQRPTAAQVYARHEANASRLEAAAADQVAVGELDY
jgi:stearoyl-CoA desaturase (delta-9 desaturase)